MGISGQNRMYIFLNKISKFDLTLNIRASILYKSISANIIMFKKNTSNKSLLAQTKIYNVEDAQIKVQFKQSFDTKLINQKGSDQKKQQVIQDRIQQENNQKTQISSNSLISNPNCPVKGVEAQVMNKQILMIKDFILTQQIQPKQLIQWINIARTDPNRMAKIMQDKMKHFIDDDHMRINGIKVKINGGKSSYMQAINFLNNQEPIHPLELNECLNLAAKDHVQDMIKNNKLTHISSDGSKHKDRITKRYGKPIYGLIGQSCDAISYFHFPDIAKTTIIRFIIDDTSASNGNRKNIFSKLFKYVGICMLKNDQKLYKSCFKFSSANFLIQCQDMEKQKPQLLSDTNLSKKNVMDAKQQYKSPIQQDENLQQQILPQKILQWVNIVRTEPKKMAQIIEIRMKNFVDERHILLNGIIVRTITGVADYQQTIDFLNKQVPISPLEYNKCLTLAARDHIMDMIKNNMFSNIGSDGSTFMDRINKINGKRAHGAFGLVCDHLPSYERPNFALATVIRYIIDADDLNRTHRKALLNPQYRYLGACTLKSGKDRYKSCINFSSLCLQIGQEVKSENIVKSLVLQNQKQITAPSSIMCQNQKNKNDFSQSLENNTNDSVITRISPAIQVLNKQPQIKQQKQNIQQGVIQDNILTKPLHNQKIEQTNFCKINDCDSKQQNINFSKLEQNNIEKKQLQESIFSFDNQPKVNIGVGKQEKNQINIINSFKRAGMKFANLLGEVLPQKNYFSKSKQKISKNKSSKIQQPKYNQIKENFKMIASNSRQIEESMQINPENNKFFSVNSIINAGSSVKKLFSGILQERPKKNYYQISTNKNPSQNIQIIQDQIQTKPRQNNDYKSLDPARKSRK